MLWGHLFHLSNAALNVLIVFIQHYLSIIAPNKQTQSDKHTVNFKQPRDFPKSLKSIHRVLGLNSDDFIQYVVCIKCDSVYELSSCLHRNSFGAVDVKSCIHIKFPNHPLRSKRQQCGASLLQKVCRDSKIAFQPYKTYAYYPIKTALARFFNREGFFSLSEQWRTRNASSEYMGDVYDGQVWKDWQCWHGRDFLAVPYSLVVTLNLDWFQPFSHVNYSVGVLYMVILNLPREERYKLENIILVSIIPGPKEPKLTVNSFLAPLVEELKELWDGISVPVSVPTKGNVVIRLAVICVACDIPAVRKMCGFAGHSACLGCSKCKYQFKHQSWGNDYSGYDRSEWQMRSFTQHRENANEYRSAKTVTEKKKCLSEHGVRYSILLELPYFDIVRYHIIDPMHNLLLGTAKHVMKTWISKRTITPRNLEIIEKEASKIKSPYDVGRMPLKISGNFAGFTADQWLNWTLIYSAVTLKGILPQPDYNCWLLFVKACSLLCCKLIKKSEVVIADQYLLQFCRNFEALHGAEVCTPNMHLHLHLKDSLIDYGPIYAFWLFSFERFNGLLGTYSTNKRNIEIQLMRKFINQQKVKDLKFPEEYIQLCKEVFGSSKHSGSLHHTSSPECMLQLKHMCTDPINQITSFNITKSVKPLHPISKKVLSMNEVKDLKALYTQLYPNQAIENISHFTYKANRVMLNNEIIGSVCSQSKKASVIGAYWPSEGLLSALDNTKLQIGIIQYFIEHKFLLKENDDSSLEHTNLLCYVKWLKPHPEYTYFGTSVIVAQRLEATESPMRYMPVQRIACRCAHMLTQLQFSGSNEDVMIAIPIARNFSII